jgi:hypothetical protein
MRYIILLFLIITENIIAGEIFCDVRYNSKDNKSCLFFYENGIYKKNILINGNVNKIEWSKNKPELLIDFCDKNKSKIVKYCYKRNIFIKIDSKNVFFDNDSVICKYKFDKINDNTYEVNINKYSGELIDKFNMFISGSVPLELMPINKGYLIFVYDEYGKFSFYKVLGKTVNRITSFNSYQCDERPIVSYDGNYVYFSAGFGQGHKIIELNLNSGKLNTVIDNVGTICDNYSDISSYVISGSKNLLYFLSDDEDAASLYYYDKIKGKSKKSAL